MNEMERAKEIVEAIKATIPLDPTKSLSHTDAFTDSDALTIIASALTDWAYKHVSIY